MSDNLNDHRKIYSKGTLSKASVDPNPLQQFRTWFYEVKENHEALEVNAMTLSTIGLDGFPKGRVVLLKKYNENGFFFYTNYNSEKGRAILENEKVSLSFFWPSLERQVIIVGTARKTSEEDSINYFDSRPDGSKLGALVSNQSSIVENRDVLERKLKNIEVEYQDRKIDKPTYWGGFVVSPKSIEFWQGRPNRLHDRIRYTLDNLDWNIERLEP